MYSNKTRYAMPSQHYITSPKGVLWCVALLAGILFDEPGCCYDSDVE